MKSNKLIAFAQDFVSFLIQHIENLEVVRNIILYGSVARFEHETESDIDIFIDTKDKHLSKRIDKLADDFYKSEKYKNYWKLFGVENRIDIKVGDLDKWELKRSLVSNGLVLYGKYKAEIEGKLYSLFIIDVKGLRSKKIKIWRKLYGYVQKVKGKKYMSEGFIKKYHGKKLSKATFMIPLEHTNEIKKFLNQQKIRYMLIDCMTDASL